MSMIGTTIPGVFSSIASSDCTGQSYEHPDDAVVIVDHDGPGRRA